MAIVLGPNRYGKERTRLLRVFREGGTHTVADLTVGVSLSGDLAAGHLTGDNGGVLPPDTMRNTVYAFAGEHGVGEPEEFALLLGTHFVVTRPEVRAAKVSVEAHGWERLGPHSFQGGGGPARTATVQVTAEHAQVVSGVTGLALMNTTGAELRGFPRDRYTTLAETGDRILATVVDARWRHLGGEADWGKSFHTVVEALTHAFVTTYSASPQQTLFSMGGAVLAAQPGVAEIRLALPDLQHEVVDLAPFGLGNDNEVFAVNELSHGLVEGTVTRDDAPEAFAQWYD